MNKKEVNVSLILDRYEDIFSDFDPRDFEFRSLSDDFIFECQRFTLFHKDNINLRLLIPKNLRNEENETKIIKRLHHHFNIHFNNHKKKYLNHKRLGFFLFLLGSILITIGAYLHNFEKIFLLNYLLVLLEPAGWFSIWNGFDNLFLKKPEDIYIFYEKMKKAHIEFVEY